VPARFDRIGLESSAISARLLGGQEIQSPDGQDQGALGGAQETDRGDGALDRSGSVAALHRANDAGQAGFNGQESKGLRLEKPLRESHLAIWQRPGPGKRPAKDI